MDEKLLGLPLHIQIALGGGYLAYLVAYAGIRQHHTPLEVFFRSIAFGLVSTAVMLWAPDAPAFLVAWKHPFWRPTTAVASTVLIGAFWRWRGMRWSRVALRELNVSWTDDIPTAWLTVTATETNIAPTQIVVDLDGGRTLMCEDTRLFEHSPFAPCIYGLDGSIAFYVTAERPAGGEWVDRTDVLHVDGDMLTYVPASAIKRVQLRLTPSSSGRSRWWRRFRGLWRRRRRNSRID
ncbi:hypothetical protein [Sphingomonas elodea]|uniref:hypothetical protein n=1 Tax=Sphingomonas elodea TaxID=179878 RepID=UPI001110A0A3|nr:hypothetical protein [Sphingomonas elodea]